MTPNTWLLVEGLMRSGSDSSASNFSWRVSRSFFSNVSPCALGGGGKIGKFMNYETKKGMEMSKEPIFVPSEGWGVG